MEDKCVHAWRVKIKAVELDNRGSNSNNKINLVTKT